MISFYKNENKSCPIVNPSEPCLDRSKWSRRVENVIASLFMIMSITDLEIIYHIKNIFGELTLKHYIVG